MIKKECKKIQNFSMKKQENVKINQNVKMEKHSMRKKECVKIKNVYQIYFIIMTKQKMC